MAAYDNATKVWKVPNSCSRVSVLLVFATHGSSSEIYASLTNSCGRAKVIMPA